MFTADTMLTPTPSVRALAMRLTDAQVRYLQNQWPGESLNAYGCTLLKLDVTKTWRRTPEGDAVLACRLEVG